MWKEYEPFIQAIVELFHPLVEVAVHDLEQGKIVALYHNLSQRKVGDPSPLKELNVQTEDFPPYFTPYYKQNYDGRELKCTSITLRKKGKPVALICINMDVNFFQEGRRFIESFLKTKQEADHPIDLYGSELEEQTMAIIHQYLQEKQPWRKRCKTPWKNPTFTSASIKSSVLCQTKSITGKEGSLPSVFHG